MCILFPQLYYMIFFRANIVLNSFISASSSSTMLCTSKVLKKNFFLKKLCFEIFWKRYEVIYMKCHKTVTSFDVLIPLLGLYFTRIIWIVKKSYVQAYLLAKVTIKTVQRLNIVIMECFYECVNILLNQVIQL